MIGMKRHLCVQLNIVVDDDRDCSQIVGLALQSLTAHRDFVGGSYDSGNSWQLEVKVGSETTSVTITSYWFNWYWPPLWLWARINRLLGWR